MFPLFPGSNIQLESTFLSIVEMILLLGFGLYVAFAFIAVRQIDIMRRTVETSFSPIIRIIGYVHLIVAILVFFFVFSLLRI